MANITYVVCHDCKIKRDLDKFYIKDHIVSDVESAKLMAGKLYYNQRRSYQSALLISFMKTHQGHNCTFSDDSTGWCMKYQDDIDYWP